MLDESEFKQKKKTNNNYNNKKQEETTNNWIHIKDEKKYIYELSR